MDCSISPTHASSSVTGLTVGPNSNMPAGHGYYIQVVSPALAGLLTLTFYWQDSDFVSRSQSLTGISLLGTNRLQGYFVVDSTSAVTADITITGLIGSVDYYYTFGYK